MKDFMVLASDGMVSSIIHGPALKRDVNKITIINECVGFTWLGAYHNSRPEIVRRCLGINDPAIVADIVHEEIKRTIKSDPYPGRLYNIAVLGFRDEMPKLYQVMSEYDSPIEQRVFMGGSACVMWDRRSQNFRQYLKEYYKSCSIEDCKETVRLAFVRALKDHPKYDSAVGGEIFIETIIKEHHYASNR